MEHRFNPNNLPSSTHIRFYMIAATVTLMTLWYGNTLPSSLSFINYYTAPLTAKISAALTISVWILTVALYLLHPLFCRRSFSKDALSRVDPQLYEELKEVAEQVGVRKVNILVDNNIKNFDAIAFGLPFRRYIALGRGNLLLRAKDPQKFRAKIIHELSHIKNVDVDVGFLSQYLYISAYVFLVSCIGYWTWTFITRRQFDIYSIDIMVGSGLSLAVGAACWLTLLWVEQRGFIRARELMADAEAAYWTSPDIVIGALGAVPHEGRKSTLGDKIKRLSSAHPVVQVRISSLENMHLIGLPSVGVIFSMGYLMSVLQSLSATLGAGYSIDDQVESWTYTAPEDVDALLSMIASDSGYLFISALTAVVLQIAFIVTVLVCLRISLQSRIIGVQSVGFAWKALVISFAYYCGYVVGDIFDPFYADNVVSSRFDDFQVDFDIIRDSVYDHFISLFFLLNFLFYFSPFLLKGRRRSSVSQTEWFIFSFVLLGAISQVFISGFVIFWLIQRSLTVGLAEDEASGIVYAVIGMALWMLLAYSSAWIIRNGKPSTLRSIQLQKVGR